MPKRTILVIFDFGFSPHQDSASLRMLNILRLLKEATFEITFVHGQDPTEPPPGNALQVLGIQTFAASRDEIATHLRAFGVTYDLIWLTGLSGMLNYYDLILKHAPRAKVLFDTTDLQYLREYRRAKVTGSADWLKIALRSRRWTLAAARTAHCTLVVSEVEADMLRHDCPEANVRILSNIHEVRECNSNFIQRSGLLFMGSFPHHPNRDAMEYFLNEIEPRVRESLPDLDIWIAGRKPPAWLLSRATGTIHVLGYVPDLEALLCRARVAIAPLRYGAGVKGKVLESMSVGLPIVATSIAAEGLGAVHEREILIADTPSDFADAIRHLYQDSSLWRQLSLNGQKLVENSFSFAAARRNWEQIMTSIKLES